MTLTLDLSALTTFLLLACRVAGVTMVAPLLGSQRMPSRLKAALALVISLALAPVTATEGEVGSALEMALAAGSELLFGAAMGFGARLIFAAIQMAGEMADMQSAFGFAGMVSPQTGERHSVIGQLQMAVAWLIFLGADGHHIILEAVAGSLGTVPLGSGPALSVAPLVEAVGGLIAAAVRMAAPIVAAVLLADFAMGLLTRAAPQMNLLAIGFPIKLALGLLATMLALPLLVSLERGLLSTMETILRGVIAGAG